MHHVNVLTVLCKAGSGHNYITAIITDIVGVTIVTAAAFIAATFINIISIIALIIII